MSTSSDRPDALWGARAIAEHLGLPLRRTFYLLQNDLIPCAHVGKQWVASRRKLDEFIAGSEKRAA